MFFGDRRTSSGGFFVPFPTFVEYCSWIFMKKYFNLILISAICSAAGAQSISSISPTKIIGGKGDILRITGSGFGASRGNNYATFMQENKAYLDAANAVKLNYTSWKDNEILLEMPNAFNGRVKVFVNGKEAFSTDTLKVTANLGYRQVNPLDYEYRSDRNGSGGITWLVHPTYWNNPDSRQAIADVVKEFRCKTGVNYLIAPLLTPVPLNLNQGLHLIAPDSALGVVGYNDRLWSSCILGAETFYHVTAQILRFSTKQNWYFGKGKVPAGMAKFRYVLFHEMGHSLGLGHVDEPGQSMYPTVTFLPSDNWCERDSITTAEKTAISHFVKLCQNFTFRACGINPLKSFSDCNDLYSSTNQPPAFSGIMQVFPNPANREFQVKLPLVSAGQNIDINIYRMDGSICYSQSLPYGQAIQLPAGFTSGVYYLRVQTAAAVYSSKLLLN